MRGGGACLHLALSWNIHHEWFSSFLQPVSPCMVSPAYGSSKPLRGLWVYRVGGDNITWSRGKEGSQLLPGGGHEDLHRWMWLLLAPAQGRSALASVDQSGVP